MKLKFPVITMNKIWLYLLFSNRPIIGHFCKLAILFLRDANHIPKIKNHWKIVHVDLLTYKPNLTKCISGF